MPESQEKTKTCTSCQQALPLTTQNYHRRSGRGDGFHEWCKACRKRDRIANLDRYRGQERASHDRHRDKRNAYSRKRWEDPEYRAKWQEVNREWHQQNAARKLEYNREWRARNPDKVKATLRSAYKRHPLRYSVSSHIAYCLKRGGASKAGRAFEGLLGYTIGELRAHVQRQFDKTMSWENWGKAWELDHIIPLASFKISSPDSEDFRAAWSLCNLRPLAKVKNRSKGGRRELLL